MRTLLLLALLQLPFNPLKDMSAMTPFAREQWLDLVVAVPFDFSDPEIRKLIVP